jgi:hypothetical protein
MLTGKGITPLFYIVEKILVEKICDLLTVTLVGLVAVMTLEF